MKRKDYFFLVVIAVILFLLLKYCGGKQTIVESVKSDTVWVVEKKDTQYIPVPTTVYLPGKVPKPLEKWDTLYIEGLTEIDTAVILREFHSFNIYSDSLKNKYGYVLVNDTISRNKILGRGVKTELKVPEITNTITLVKPPHNQVFIGGGVFGSKSEALQGYELSALFKTKTDQIIETAWMQDFNGQGYFAIRYKRLIRLKK